jgi:hypothetical protein
MVATETDLDTLSCEDGQHVPAIYEGVHPDGGNWSLSGDTGTIWLQSPADMARLKSRYAVYGGRIAHMADHYSASTLMGRPVMVATPVHWARLLCREGHDTWLREL